MIDEASYNAMSKALLIDMSLAQLQSGTLSLWEAYELAWLSSAKYHTKRERERCAALCRKVAEEPCLIWALPLTMTDREAIAEECALLIEQEPKP